jgi:hypothetical protein
LLAACILGFLTTTSAQLRVLAPQRLVKDLGKHGQVEASTATFGAPFFGDRVLGRLLYPKSRGKDYCNAEDYDVPVPDDSEPSLRGNSQAKELINIVMVKRGVCTFTTKVRIAQEKGAHAVVIIDKDDSTLTSSSLHNIIVADDGHGVGIHIPSILIAKDEGKKMTDALDTGSAVIVELKWTLPTDSVVQMDLWMSTGSAESLKFLADFAESRKQLNKVVKFQPHYAVFSVKDPQASAVDLCWDITGEFCAEDPDGYGSITGKQVLEEDVRQLCIHEKTSSLTATTDTKSGTKAVMYADKYWEYVKLFADRCPLDGKGDAGFGPECATKLLRSISSDQLVGEVSDCIANTRLTKLNEQIKNTAWSPRALRINGWRYTGMMDADLVTRAVCSAFDLRPPAECTQLLKPRDPHTVYKGSEGANSGGLSFSTFFILLLLVIGISFCAMFLYRRSMKTHMHQTIREEVMLEVQSAMSSYSKMPNERGAY